MRFLHRKPQWDESIIYKKIGDRFCNLYPTVEDVWRFCDKATRDGSIISVDVETTGEQPLNSQLICVGMASSNGDAICVPRLRQFGYPYWDAADGAKVVEILRWFLGNPNVPKVFQNGSFDTVVLWANGILVNGYDHDLIYGHHIIDSELPHGLAYQASRFLEIPFWKDDVKGDKKFLDIDDYTMRRYNLIDCLVTIRLLPIILAQVRNLGLENLYQEELQIGKIMAESTVRGIMIDLKRRDDETIDFRKEIPIDPKKPEKGLKPNRDYGYPLGLGPRLRKRREEALTILRRVARNPKFSPRSVPQLKKLLFEDLNFPIVKRTEKGAASTDKDAMALLALHAESQDQFDALESLIKYRKNDKLITSYIENMPILSDQRLHVTWKVYATVSGRFGATFGAQTWNKAIKRIFRAPEGSKLVGVDLSQAELRTIGYFARDPILLDAYNKGLNIHTINTTVWFQVKNPGEDTNPATEEWLEQNVTKLTGKQYSSLPVPPKDKWERMRRLSKVGEFSSSYGAIAETMYEQIRAERDPETDELLFPDVTLSQVEAMRLMKMRTRPRIPLWWKEIQNQVIFHKKYQSPLSGRIRWFRAGFKLNEILNMPIQEGVAAHMNKSTIRIDKRIKTEIGYDSGLVLQVHDALIAESKEYCSEHTGKIFTEELSKPFELFDFKEAKLPPDKIKIGVYLNEV